MGWTGPWVTPSRVQKDWPKPGPPSEIRTRTSGADRVQFMVGAGAQATMRSGTCQSDCETEEQCRAKSVPRGRLAHWRHPVEAVQHRLRQLPLRVFPAPVGA